MTMDFSAKNLHLFRTDHWLSNPMNCLVLRLTAPAWSVPGVASSSFASQETSQDRLAACSASDLRALLESQDMRGPAAHLFAQSVNGADLLALTQEELVTEVRVTPFVAKKLLRARATLLDNVL